MDLAEEMGTGGGRFEVPSLASAVLDRQGTIIGWSPLAERLLGHPAADVLGRPAAALLRDVVEVDPAEVDKRCRAEGGWCGLLPARHRDGHEVDIAARVSPLAAPGRAPLWLVTGMDAGRTWWADRAMLGSVLTSTPFGVAVLDEDLRFVWLNDALQSIGGLNRTRRLGRRLGEVQPGLPTESIETRMRQVLRTGKPAVDVEVLGRPAGDPDRDHAYSTSYFRLDDPVGRVLGVCCMIIDVTDRWRARNGLALLGEASARIGGSLDPQQTAQDLADVAVPGLADLVTVDLLEWVLRESEPAPGLVAGRPPLRRAGQQSVRKGCPESATKIGDCPDYIPTSPAIQCLVGGKALLEPVLATRPPTAENPHSAASYDRFGLHSLITVPIQAHAVIMGVASFFRWQRGYPFDSDDLLLAEEFVSRAAVCIDNARRYTRERTAAVTLQRSLLPHGLPGQTAVEVSSYYLPADAQAGVGGDWFDIIPLSGARVALVVGEVVGHGLHAAATMGRLRAAVHTLAALDLPPDELLAHLDDLAIRLTEEDDAAGGPVACSVLGATCLYVVYDPVSRRCTLARAGHPPPAVVSPDAVVDFPDLPAGPPLGLGGMPFESAELELAEGCLLALYTDGLIQARDHDIRRGLDLLHRTLAQPGWPLPKIREGVIEALLPDRPDDDVTLLLARTRSLPADQVATWDLRPDPAAVATARAEARRQVTGWGFDDLAFTTELVVSELVTNAIRYASPPLRLRLIRERTLICEVSDGSSTSPRLRHARTTDEGGRGLFLVSQFTQRWGARYTPQGKTIWAELALPAAAGPPTRSASAAGHTSTGTDGGPTRYGTDAPALLPALSCFL
jgi:PAS domain S-box-containing protein